MVSHGKIWWLIGVCLLLATSSQAASWKECRRSLGQLVSIWGEEDLQRFQILADAPPSGPKQITRERIREANQEALDLLDSMAGLSYEVIPDKTRRWRDLPTAFEIVRGLGRVQGPRDEGGLMISILSPPRPDHDDPLGWVFTHRRFGESFQELQDQQYTLAVDTTSHLLGEGGRHYNGRRWITLGRKTSVRTLFHEMGHKDFEHGDGFGLITEVKNRVWWNEPLETLLDDPRYQSLGEKRIRIIASLAERGLPTTAINEIIAGQRELEVFDLDATPPFILKKTQQYTRSYIASLLLRKAEQFPLTQTELSALADGVADYLQRPDLSPTVIEAGNHFLESYPGPIRLIVFPDRSAPMPEFRQPVPRSELPLSKRYLPKKKVVVVVAGGSVAAMVVSGLVALGAGDEEETEERTTEPESDGP